MPGVLSRLKDAGRRNGTSAPSFFATVAILLSSVLTTTRLTKFAAFAARIVQAINGIPPIFRIFLCGTLFDPALAGMIASTLGEV